MTGNALVAISLTIKQLVGDLDNEPRAETDVTEQGQARRRQLRESLLATSSLLDREAGRRLVAEASSAIQTELPL